MNSINIRINSIRLNGQSNNKKVIKFSQRVRLRYYSKKWLIKNNKLVIQSSKISSYNFSYLSRISQSFKFKMIRV